MKRLPSVEGVFEEFSSVEVYSVEVFPAEVDILSYITIVSTLL